MSESSCPYRELCIERFDLIEKKIEEAKANNEKLIAYIKERIESFTQALDMRLEEMQRIINRLQEIVYGNGSGLIAKVNTLWYIVWVLTFVVFGQGIISVFGFF